MNRMLRIIAVCIVLLATAGSLGAQSSRFVCFFSTSESIKIAYYLDSPGEPADYADLYSFTQDGVAKLLEPASRTCDGKRVVIEYNDVECKANHRFGFEFRLFLPLTKEAKGLTITDFRKEMIPIEEEYPDKPIVIRNLAALGSPAGVRPADAPVNKLEMAFDTKVIDASCDKAKDALVTYTVKAGESVEDVIAGVRAKAGLNTSANFPSIRQRRDRRLYEWNQRHASILNYNAAVKPNVILIGDSITHYWGDQAGCYIDFGREYFDELFAGWRPTNLGYGWDRIDNMLWRIDHGEMDGYSAKHVFIMAGTNNIGAKTPEEQLIKVADGLVELVQMIRSKQPKARIHFVLIYPRRGTEANIQFVNKRASEALQGMSNLDFIDTWPVLADENGKTIDALYSDGTHPNAAGYKLIAEVYKPYLCK